MSTTLLEKKLAAASVQKLRRNLRSAIAQTTSNTFSGQAKKTTARSKFRAGRLDRLTIVSPHYIFKQHYGFEGTKKNGVTMRLKATNVLNVALDKSNLLEDLATGIANIRSEEVITKINF